MDTNSAADHATFRQWTDLTDLYARVFLRVQAGDRSAVAELRRLSGELLRINQAIGSPKAAAKRVPADNPK